jgi:signal transduction histidine kinase
MRVALILATVVVPLYTALIHGWIWLLRRRESEYGAFALSALGMAIVAGGLVAQCFAATPASAYRWQQVQLVAASLLLSSFLRWLHLYLALRRPRIEAAGLALALATLAGVAADVLFAPALELRATLPFYPPAWNAPLAPAGQILLSGYVFFIVYPALVLGGASRRNRHARPVFLTYVAFAGCLLYDAARGARLADGPELLPFGYLGMVVGISAALIRRFVLSMEQAARLAGEWHERVEERSAELRRRELQLVHGERLATLGTLAAGVAHEINDPMAFVSSNLNRVEELWGHREERNDIPEILAECREGLARLRGTVAELLRLARGSDAGSLPVDLAEVVASVLPLVHAEARYGARLDCDLAPVPAVLGNPGLLAQVALQLVLNAIRAVPPEQAAGHSVRVATRAEARTVLLQVRDEGLPLPPELLPHLFDPFASLALDATARADGAVAAPGARLGLAVTHQIVTRHGGALSVESDANGTTFTVSLPVLEAATAKLGAHAA